MSSGKRRGSKDLSQFLDSHVRSINETFQMLETAPPYSPSLAKADWSEVVKHGDEVSKQATVAGMVWGEDSPDPKGLKENIITYFNSLQGILLISYSSSIGAGPTLHKSIHAASKRVLDSSLSLFKEAVSSYETKDRNRRAVIPQLTGAVWEACEGLKKTPSSNCVAIGRAMTQLGVYIKDILREMNELISPKTSKEEENDVKEEDDDIITDDENDDLSPDEEVVVKLVISIASNTYEVLKETIRFITGLLRNKQNKEESVDSLERLLCNFRRIADWCNDLGACVYSPQDIPQIEENVSNLRNGVGLVRKEIEIIKAGGNAEGVYESLNKLEGSLREIEGFLSADVAGKMEKLEV
ncbi:hypothetical protein LUZ60_004579 [Juncus effusus]|nr:hypothetical protein LUZ60_004579 [Juncus effusus]